MTPRALALLPQARASSLDAAPAPTGPTPATPASDVTRTSAYPTRHGAATAADGSIRGEARHALRSTLPEQRLLGMASDPMALWARLQGCGIHLARNAAGLPCINGRAVRVTPGPPKLIALLDALAASCHISRAAAKQVWEEVTACDPSVNAKVVRVKLRGRGQKPTLCATIDAILYVLSQTNTATGDNLKRMFAELIVARVGGNLNMAILVLKSRQLQEELAANDPNHPMRLFGLHVEASGGA